MSNLLLVDDNTQILDLYKLVLEEAGHQVRTAETRGRAVQLLKEIDPEIVVMDLRMPEMEDGLGLIRTLKNHVRPRGKTRIKVIVMSGWSEDLLDTPEKDSVDCVLSKPVRIELLLQSIAKLAVMLFLCLAAAHSLMAETFHFSVTHRGEVMAHLDISPPGSKGSEAGRGAALAVLAVDG